MGANPQSPLPDDHDVRQFLSAWDAPAPDPAAKARLFDALAEVPLPTAWVGAPPMSLRHRLRHAALILRTQLRVVSMITWLASMLVIAFGVLVTFMLRDSGSDVIPLVIVSPIVTAVGVAFLYGEEVDPALELQLSTPVSPQLILLARLVLLFGFDLVLSLIGSVILAGAADYALDALIVSWLVPMTFLSAGAFLLSVLFFDPLQSVLIALMCWTVIVLRHFGQHEPLIALPDLLAVEFRPLLIAAALGLLITALSFAERDERFTRKDNA